MVKYIKSDPKRQADKSLQTATLIKLYIGTKEQKMAVPKAKSGSWLSFGKIIITKFLITIKFKREKMIEKNLKT